MQAPDPPTALNKLCHFRALEDIASVVSSRVLFGPINKHAVNRCTACGVAVSLYRACVPLNCRGLSRTAGGACAQAQRLALAKRTGLGCVRTGGYTLPYLHRSVQIGSPALHAMITEPNNRWGSSL
jgi:hypothetical protein